VHKCAINFRKIARRDVCPIRVQAELIPRLNLQIMRGENSVKFRITTEETIPCRVKNSCFFSLSSGCSFNIHTSSIHRHHCCFQSRAFVSARIPVSQFSHRGNDIAGRPDSVRKNFTQKLETSIKFIFFLLRGSGNNMCVSLQLRKADGISSRGPRGGGLTRISSRTNTRRHPGEKAYATS